MQTHCISFAVTDTDTGTVLPANGGTDKVRDFLLPGSMRTGTVQHAAAF